MDYKHEEKRRARELYFQSDLSQERIAEILNINRKTLYGWIKEGGWRSAKYSARHAPNLLVDQYYAQLGELNNHIMQRTERPFPTKEEADIQRKVSMTIKTVRNDKFTCTDTIHLFSLFNEKLMRRDFELYDKLWPHMDDHIREISEDGKWLEYSLLRYEEKMEDDSYREWLQRNPREASKEETPDNNNNPPSSTPSAPAPQTPLSPQRGDNGVTLGGAGVTHGVSENNSNSLKNNELTKSPGLLVATTKLEMGCPALPAEASAKEGGDRETEKTSSAEAFISRRSIAKETATADSDTAKEGEALANEDKPKPGTAAYYATLPPDQRPSPFKEGNIIWVNHVYDASEKYRDSMKMCERIEHYPGMFSHQDYRPKMPYAVYPG